jgi:predicted nuclease of predicted toxin-antitoxin system
MKFIVDQQLPPAIGGWLRQRGHEAEHVRNIDLRDAPDAEIWKRATGDGASILTKDEDFAARRNSVTAGPAIIWLRCGNVSTEVLIELLAREWPVIESELDRGASVIEVR